MKTIPYQICHLFSKAAHRTFGAGLLIALLAGGTVSAGTLHVWQDSPHPADPHVVSGNPDQDPFTTFQEWLADTDPTNASSYFRIETISKDSPATVTFQSSSHRVYSLFSATNLAEANWTEVPGQTAVPGTGGLDSLMDTNTAPAQFYRVGVRPPP